MSLDAIDSYIQTLCETILTLEGEVGSERKDRTLRQLKQAIEDYFAIVDARPGALGVEAKDGVNVGDFFG